MLCIARVTGTPCGVPVTRANLVCASKIHCVTTNDTNWMLYYSSCRDEYRKRMLVSQL